VKGDRYGGIWPRDRFCVHGVDYQVVGKSASDFYCELLPILNSGRAELLDHARLVTQLCQLERHAGSGMQPRDPESRQGQSQLTSRYHSGEIRFAAESGDSICAMSKYLCQASAEQFQQRAEFLPLSNAGLVRSRAVHFGSCVDGARLTSASLR